MPLTEYTYIFAVGTIFALLDAYNIGANDVANAWATSVSSKSLTMRQAMLGAAVFEFVGAVAVGARVADTIKNGIIPTDAFQGNPGVQMLAFTCALMVSASWLMFCTHMGFPVSTTYSIVSAVAGVGVATAGADSVRWGWNGGKGLAAIFAGLVIAPCLAAGFGAAVYLIIKFGILARKNPVAWSIYTGPFFFFLTAAVCTMSIVYKGAPSLGLSKMSETKTALAIVLTSLVVAIFAALFWIPYVHAKVVKKDYTIRWYHFFMGPALWFRKAPTDALDGDHTFVPDYRVTTNASAPAASSNKSTLSQSSDEEKVHPTDANMEGARPAVYSQPKETSWLEKQYAKLDEYPVEGNWYEPRNLRIILKHRAFPRILKALTYGSGYDVHAAQAGEAGTAEGQRMAAMLGSAKQYPNEVEHTYSFIQVLTACTASFAHGANDVANAIGPWAVIYQVWHAGTPAASKAPVPIWILIVGGIMIVIGLATYGYRIMRVLGNKLTYMSPSRGCSMELGAAITVILASQYGLPVSTTMCITGATVGVGLCNGTLKSVNWRNVAWIYTGWVLTIPVVGTLAGCLMGFILNAPHFA